MSWVDEQIRQRLASDQRTFQASLEDMAEMVTGTGIFSGEEDGHRPYATAMEKLLRFYNRKPLERFQIEDYTAKSFFSQLEQQGILWRSVTLQGKWFRSGVSPLLVQGDITVLLLPSKGGGYHFQDVQTGKDTKVTKENAPLFQGDVCCFYRPFPQEALTKKDFFTFVGESIQPRDIGKLMLSALMVMAIGLLSPMASKLLFSQVLPTDNVALLWSVAVLLLGASISMVLFRILHLLVIHGIEQRMKIEVKSAVMMRLLALPSGFFRQYSSGDLAERLGQVERFCEILVQGCLSLVVSVLFSLVYLGQISVYTPTLVLPTYLVMFTLLLVSLYTIKAQEEVARACFSKGKERGVLLGLLNAISKIKTAGAERRGFSRWASQYSQGAAKRYNPPIFLRIQSVLVTFITGLGTLLCYQRSLSVGVNQADYMAFTVAYGMLLTSFLRLAQLAPTLGELRPALDMFFPILSTVPEQTSQKKPIQRLMGGVELAHVGFRYDENMPWVLDDLSLKVRPGEYLGIVGGSGSGKSTLLRLLLGFEKPDKGGVYWDGRDATGLDMQSVRQRIGVVLQQSQLFGGSIYENLTIWAPETREETLWRTLEQVGIAQDIRQMPLGLHTLLSDGGGGISGGQGQRLLIARALLGSPKVLLMDEATSALDGGAQQQVTQVLDGLSCTRIVIAHRVSTLKHCHRIVVLDQGKIVESGTYENLLARNGLFATLAKQGNDAG